MINLKVSVGSKREEISKTPNIQCKKDEEEPELRSDFIDKIKRREKQKPVKYDF